MRWPEFSGAFLLYFVCIPSSPEASVCPECIPVLQTLETCLHAAMHGMLYTVCNALLSLVAKRACLSCAIGSCAERGPGCGVL